MATFKKYYSTLFDVFGYPLSKRDSLSPDILRTAQKRLGIPIPPALRDYFLVAGGERRFSPCHNRLLAPAKWSIDKQRLVFMEENQRVVYWGVSIRNPDAVDPSVSQGINEEPISWHPESKKLSVFLAVMLHYQAVSGGFSYCGQATAPQESDYRFDEHGWVYYGEVNSLLAHSRPNQVICLMPPGDLPFVQNWTVLAGGRTKADLKAIATDLEIAIN
jgi:hypothetical protein